MKHNLYVLVILLAIICIGCTANVNSYKPEQLINNALVESESQKPYYGEVIWKAFEQDMGVSEFVMKMWYNIDGKLRIETEGDDRSITVYDGQAVTVYSIDENEAFIIEDPELSIINQQSPKEQANELLEGILETHTIEVVGEEKIAGQRTHHLIATAKEDNVILGNQELWIDKKNWLVLKQIIYSGDTRVEIIYDKIDYGKKMDPALFVLDLPESVQIQHESDLKKQLLTLEEAKLEMNQSFLYFPETDELEITEISTIRIEDVHELFLTYEQNGLPLFNLTISELGFEIDEAFVELMDGKLINIRGHKGYYTEGDIRMYEWIEGGLNYSAIIIDPSLTTEGFLEMTEEMKMD